MEQPKRKKLTIETLVGIVVGTVVMVLVQQFFFKAPTLDEAMTKAAKDLNKTCPIMVDQYSRLDSTLALPGHVFQYNFTLVNLEKSEVNLDTVKKYIEPGIINNIKTNPEMKKLRDNKVAFNYYYRDKKGVFVLNIAVTPDQYQ